MNNTDNYIATSQIPVEIIIFAEMLTVVIGLWVLYEVARLVWMYSKHKKDDIFANILTFTFVGKALTTIVIIFMGAFLFANWELGVKSLVIIRPFFELFGAFWLRRLRKYHERHD